MTFESPKSKPQTVEVTGSHPYMFYNGCGYGIANIQPRPREHTKKGTPFRVYPMATGKCEVLFGDYSSEFADFYVTIGK